MITMVMMGLSTLFVGLLPTYAQVGVWAPALLVFLRLTQGLAVGGEYGSAATYVAEHAPPAHRGYYTSWLQTTSTIGLLLSLLVILACRLTLGDDAFKSWGWRIPFLTSIVLLAVSVYIRLKLEESPVFHRMKLDGRTSKSPNQGELRLLGQYKGRSRAVVRHHVRNDGDLVWRAVLRAIFHAKHAAGRLQDELRDLCRRLDPWNATHRSVRRAVRSG